MDHLYDVMRVALNEIWNFIDLIDKGEKGWTYALTAGDLKIEKISHETLLALRDDESYDTELLPSLFTFREILWQPDVFTETAMSLPGLRILKAFCEETATEYSENGSDVNRIYAQLVEGMAAACTRVIEKLETGDFAIIKALRDLREDAFPIIKFFTFHPKNRLDYHRDAINRLNYTVKVMLTQFHGRYTELEDPYWEVTYQTSAPKKVKEKQPAETED